MKYVLSFSDAGASTLARVGGKGHGLAWLQRNGFSVPEGWILTTESFDRLVADLSLERLVKALETASRAHLDPLAAEIRNVLHEGAFPDDILAELERFLFSRDDFEKSSFAVRSSAVDEDGGLHSFAGQMESVLNVRGREPLLEAVKICMMSAFGDTALKYRLQCRVPLKVRSAVVIQKMVPADVSGVAFSADVAGGRRDTVVISANWGYGDGVVGGHCDCDEYRVRPDGSLEQKIAFKDRKSDGRVLIDVALEARRKPCLNPDEISLIGHTVKRIAALKGRAQDVEWALAGGKLHILQTRPVTRLAPDERNEKTFVFDNSNIQESYCGLTSPLTFSFASDAYYNVYSQVMRIMGFAEKEVQKHARRHRSLLALVQGRVYYNINNWYEGLLLLPSFGRNKEDMERMMGLSEPVEFVRDLKLSLKEKMIRLPSMMILLGRLLHRFMGMKKLAGQFESWFQREFNKVDRHAFHTLGAVGLVEQGVKMKRVFLENWGIPIINDFYVMMMNGKVARKLKALNQESEMAALISSEDIVSLEPTRQLLGILGKIRSREAVRRVFENPDGTGFMEKVQCLDGEIYRDLTDYIEKFGDRCIGELKLESRSLREDPAFLHDVLRGYLKKDELTLESFESRQRNEKERAEEVVFAAVKRRYGRAGLLFFERDLKRLRFAVKCRESMRLARTRVFGLFRSLYLELGTRFWEFGILRDQMDIFYLTENEIDEYVTGRSSQGSLQSLVALRKNEYAQFEKTDMPHQLAMAFPMLSFMPSSPHQEPERNRPPESTVGEGGMSLQGIGCFPGKVRSRVKVVTRPDGRIDVSGKILCALRTDPGWTPLFAGVDGLLVERGSSLSHSAVVAREMGIPAIVGIPGLMKILDDGELVEMDGAAGTLKRMPEGTLGEKSENP